MARLTTRGLCSSLLLTTRWSCLWSRNHVTRAAASHVITGTATRRPQELSRIQNRWRQSRAASTAAERPLYVPYIKDRLGVPGSTGEGFPHLVKPPRRDFPYEINAVNVEECSGLHVAGAGGLQCFEACTEFLKKTTQYQTIHKALIGYGVLLFRGFPLVDPVEFGNFFSGMKELRAVEYVGNVGREERSEKVYYASPHPREMTIDFHNELAYTEFFAQVVAFGCVSAADVRCGGESIMASNREVMEFIDKEILNKFEETGVMFTYYWPDKDREAPYCQSWQEIFHTEDRQQAEKKIHAQCSKILDLEWDQHGTFKYSYVLPAFHKHYITGEKIWLTSVTNSHGTALTHAHPYWAKGGRLEGIEAPYTTLYGDGTPIPDSVLQNIRNAYWRCAVGLQLLKGDVLVYDNESVMHGRLNWTSGNRQMQVTVLRK